MPTESTPHRCPACGAAVSAGVEARGSRWHPDCLTRATLEDALEVSTYPEARAPRGTLVGAARERPPRAVSLRPLERFLQALLVATAVAVLATAIYIMLRVGPEPDNLITRLCVAAAALGILAAIDTQYGRLVSRLAPLGLTESPRERRYRVRSVLLLVGAAGTLGTMALRPDLLPNALRGPNAWYVVPVGLSALAFAVVVFGLRRSPKYRQPERWRGGVIATAVGLVLLWLLPLGAMGAVARDLVPRDLGAILVVIALVVALGVIGGGMDALAKANNTPKDDSWDIF